jgi:polyisoprenoid-binding protein YceI
MKKKYKHRRFVPSILSNLLLLTVALPAGAQTFHTTDSSQQVVHFYAQHTLGEVDGTLTPVTGTLTFNPSAPEEGLSGRFTADMSNFDTGLGLRDKDMRNKYLETEQYPEAVFSLDDATPTLLNDSSPDTLRFAVSGALTLHGVTKDHVVEATLTPTANGYDVLASFPLLLSDYDIPQPKRFLLTVQDEIRVQVRLNLE